ncbi:MAG: SH3 domain-containing protein [Pseudomonadota bacterium]
MRAVSISVIFACVLGAWPAAAERGPETNLPLPRFVSLKASEGNVRRGPSLKHRIDWVFTRRNMPLQVVAEHGHWRRVEDREGAGGWVHYTLLSGVRTVLIEQDLAPLHAKPDASSAVEAYAEAGVIARLGVCDGAWCRISADGARGWVKRSAFWGLMPGETRE